MQAGEEPLRVKVGGLQETTPSRSSMLDSALINFVTTAEHLVQAAVEFEKYTLAHSSGDPSSRGRVQFPLGPYYGLGPSLPSPF